MKKLQFTKGDFFGGLTAGIVALPLALAFGVQSGMGAIAGLYGSIILGFLASIFGGTASQISGPTGPMTVVSAATVAGFIALTGDFQSALPPIIACFVLAGLFQILMGVIRIGSLIKFIPYPVVSGFMSGIGVIIILLQIFPALGKKSPASTVDVIKNISDSFEQVNYISLAFAALCVLIIYLFPKITKKVPSTLVALLAVTGLSLLINSDVPVIGLIPEGLPDLKLDGILGIDPKFYSIIVIDAITLAALGAIDSLLTSVVADNLTKTKHGSNRELFGQGIGNTIAGMFGGLPGAGATMRTLVNIQSGGRNRISGVIHALTLTIVLLGAGKYAALIPNAVLAGILITVGIGILDYRGFKHLLKVPRSDAVIMIIVLFVTVFMDLLIAVAIGMVLASVLFMKKMSEIVEEKTSSKELANFERDVRWDDENIPEDMLQNVYVKHLDGPLFFGFATDFQKLFTDLPELKYVIIRLKKVPYIDQTGLYALEEAILTLERKGVEVLMTGISGQPADMLRRIKIIPDLVSEKHLFESFNDCVNWIASELRSK
jgi:sulfate permease, SulP family